MDRAIEIAPGETLRFDGQLHYHRLVGYISMDGLIAVRLVRIEGGSVALEKRGRDVRLNDLIRCCDDRAWTPYALVIENPGTESVRGHAQARLVHDDVAVMVYGAESFTRESVLILGAIWVAVLWRTLRRPRPTTVRRTLLPLLVVASASLGLATFGELRFGATGVPGYLAALSDLSLVPANPIVSGVSLLLALTIFGWGFAARRWAISRSVVPFVAWAGIGVSIIGSVALVAALIASAYDSAGIPIASAVSAAGPVAAVMVWVVARERLRSAA